MKVKKTFFIALLALILCACSNSNKKTIQEEEAIIKTIHKNERGFVSMYFDFGDKIIDFDEVPWREGLNVYDILQQIDADHITFSVTDTLYGGLGYLILGFNDIKNTNSNYWTYCLNGTKSNRGVNKQDLKSGDILNWYYGNSKNPCNQKEKEL